jgi:hypothetical protein
MRPIRLLTTRLKTAMAVGLTGLVFALSIPQELHPVYTKSSWLFRDGVPHSWLALTGDIAMYACLCLTGFYAAYVTRGRERLIIIGWLGFLLSPIRTLRPEWAVPVGDLGFFGETV